MNLIGLTIEGFDIIEMINIVIYEEVAIAIYCIYKG